MLIRRADKDTEAGVLPSVDMFTAMLKYNDELAKAGVLLQAVGLQPSSKGARVRITPGKPLLTDGPFAETKELIAGFTMIQVKSREEAIEWVKRWPAIDAGAEIEIRQLFEAEDLGPNLTQALSEQEEHLRKDAETRRKA
jgi:hypothetical protein